MAKNDELSQTAVLKQKLRRTSSRRRPHGCECPPVDVPKGHFVVYAGKNQSRFIVPISYLVHAEFQAMLRHAEEEFGFDHNTGLIIPCEEGEFRLLTRHFDRKG